MAPKVYILILSYRNPRDTIECLESILRLDYPNFKVVVCDNASPDGEWKHLLDWASGNQPAKPAVSAMQYLTSPPVPKPIRYTATDDSSGIPQPEGSVTFIRCGSNYGYAGGNNVGLRAIMSASDADFVWILNNDTVVRPDALRSLVTAAQADSTVGLWGSSVRYYYDPETAQARGGGRYNPWLGVSTYVTEHAHAPKSLDYIVGAATLVTARFLDEVGLMSEDYFLYFEELDWAERGKKAGFKLGVCADSVVFHKEGASTGIARNAKAKSAFSDYYIMRNRILFARRFRPWTTPTIYCGVFLSCLIRLSRGQMRNARVIGRLLSQMLCRSMPANEKHPVVCD